MDSQGPHIAFLLLLWASFAILQSLSIPVQFSIIGNDADELIASEERVAELFRQWRVAHRKVYHHPSEAERRFHNFWNNLRYVADNNSKRRSPPAGHQVGLNKFADMSNEEFKQVYLSKKIIRNPADRKGVNRGRSARGSVVSCDAPSSLDWRKEGVVTAVKDQGSCGSCWAFSSTGAMEGINAIVTKDLISLSEQELVDCDTTNYGCEGGYMDYAFEWVINNGGIDSEANYPYLGVDSVCNTTKEKTKVVTIDGYRDVEALDSALLCAVVDQPISVGMDGSAIDFQLYTGGIYNGSCSDNPDDIDHAVLIVGYGSEDGEDYWIIKNSWGTEWGMEGYFYLLRNTDEPDGKCAVNAMASYPTKESSPSPSPFPSPAVQPPPPPPPSPPPPSPSPSECGDFSYCAATETCCCILKFGGFCEIYGCCGYEDAVCCTGTDYCCPHDYPICDTVEGLCLQGDSRSVSVAAKKKRMAKHKLPWSKVGTEKSHSHQPLPWKMNPFEAVR